MKKESTMQETLKKLLTTQKFAVLATQEKKCPYLSLMAFTATDDLKKLIFATERGTRKHSNLIAHPHTAALVDNRANQSSDTEEALAVTALGVTRECEKSQYKRSFLKKHPQMESFVKSSTSTFIEMEVSSYLMIRGLFGAIKYQP